MGGIGIFRNHIIGTDRSLTPGFVLAPGKEKPYNNAMIFG
jgi:hypothetical protein